MPLVVTTEWLRELVPTDLAAQAIAEKLSDVGLAVDAFEAIGGGEARLELEAPTNRGDCWSVLGIARELAAAIGKKVKPPKMNYRASGGPASGAVNVKVAAPDLCPRYTARVIRGVKVGPSPEWMQRRLETIGIRPISNVVDVTNYVLMEMGQPLHAFDMALLAGKARKTVIVRRAGKGEKMELLDETTRELTKDDLVIADSERAVALAGVMGGVHTEIGGTTTDVLLESAQFNQISTRRTSRRHGAVTESSIRFEHGVDPVGVDLASRRAGFLFVQVAGGKVAPGVVDSNPKAWKPREVTLRHSRVAKLLGGELPDKDIVRILKSLGLENVKKPARKGAKRAAGVGAVTTWRVPSWRQELGIEVDLIEDVARVYGYNRLPGKPTMRVFPVRPHAIFEARRKARDVLTGVGYTEVVGASFFSPENASSAGEKCCVMSNPVRADEPALRTSLLPSLLAARLANQNFGRTKARLFEVAPVCRAGRAQQFERLAVLADAGEGKAQAAYQGVMDALDQIMQVLAPGMCERVVSKRTGQPMGRMAGFTLRVGQGQVADLLDARMEPFGNIGLVSGKLLESWGLKDGPAYLELDLQALAESAGGPVQAEPLPVFPDIVRDTAIVVQEEKTWTEVRDAAAAIDDPTGWRSLPRFTDLYRGKQIGAGKKSIAFRVVYQAPDRTLTDEDVKVPHQEFVQKLCQALGAMVRQ